MKDTCYLIADRYGVKRLTKRPPSLSRNEIGVAVKITIPDSAFRSPFITTSLDVPEDSVIQPIVEMEIVEEPA